jgi:hypothetical protein
VATTVRARRTGGFRAPANLIMSVSTSRGRPKSKVAARACAAHLVVEPCRELVGVTGAADPAQQRHVVHLGELVLLEPEKLPEMDGKQVRSSCSIGWPLARSVAKARAQTSSARRNPEASFSLPTAHSASHPIYLGMPGLTGMQAAWFCTRVRIAV